MLRKIRITLATIFFVAITLLFLDFSGTLHAYLSWMTKIQFLPAVLALNVGIIIGLVVLTLIFGRLYCSVICPLGVMQDIIAFFGKKTKKNRYSYSNEKRVLRIVVLVLFIILMIAGLNSIAILIAPYSAYGRIAQGLLQPIYMWANNGLAYLAEQMNSYAFYSVDVWVKSVATLVVAIATLLIIGFLAWKNGRTYCNTICPVGTVLGYIAKFSWLRPVINTDKCNSCGLCAMNCKAACINPKEHTIDMTRCVVCGDCLNKCKKNAIEYRHISSNKSNDNETNSDRRKFLSITALLATSSIINAQNKKVDGGLAVIKPKKRPARQTRIVPAGAKGIRNMSDHCTGCQLCVSACPNGILQPGTSLLTLMQPEMSFEKGYCRPECTKCSEVCPTGAIRPISIEEKSSTQIGHAVWVKELCVVLTDDVSCGNCERHCPSGAITMVDYAETGKKIPTIDTARCIGCGACEHLCPARPLSAIYVEGNEMHSDI